MSRRVVCLVLLSAAFTLNVREVEAQIVRRILDRRAAILAPPVDPNAPAPAAGAAAVPPAELPWRGGFFARRLQQRRDLVAQQAAEAQPTPASPALPQRSPQQPQARAFQALRQASASAAPAMRALTSGEISAMAVPALQTALSNTSGELSNELNRFSSATSWQGFLNLPAGVVDEETIDLAVLQSSLLRFESVASNPQFGQIAELPSFNQARSLLTELVNRVDEPATDGPQLIDPAGETQLSVEAEQLEESLPAPPPQLPRNEGEHSILVRE